VATVGIQPSVQRTLHALHPASQSPTKRKHSPPPSIANKKPNLGDGEAAEAGATEPKERQRSIPDTVRAHAAPRTQHDPCRFGAPCAPRSPARSSFPHAREAAEHSSGPYWSWWITSLLRLHPVGVGMPPALAVLLLLLCSSNSRDVFLAFPSSTIQGTPVTLKTVEPGTSLAGIIAFRGVNETLL